MLPFVELECVQETRDLAPNLVAMAKALFGDHAYVSCRPPRLADWITDARKIGDGLVWLPWRRQLWLVELEWKPGSNFFDQSRAFGRSRADRGRLSTELRTLLGNIEDVLHSAFPGLKEGKIADGIVDQTLDRYFSRDGFLEPDLWLILGHEARPTGSQDSARNELREAYEDELRRVANKRYVLSMARMFQGGPSAYILLEQRVSAHCSDEIRPSVLLPAVAGEAETRNASSSESTTSHQPAEAARVDANVVAPASTGLAPRIWNHLRQENPGLAQGDVRLCIQMHGQRIALIPAWDRPSPEMVVRLSREDRPMRVEKAVSESLGRDTLGEGHIARRYGEFVDNSSGQCLGGYWQIVKKSRRRRTS